MLCLEKEIWVFLSVCLNWSEKEKFYSGRLQPLAVDSGVDVGVGVQMLPGPQYASVLHTTSVSFSVNNLVQHHECLKGGTV